MTVFERYPKSTLLVITLLLGALALALLEWSAKTFFGLGNVVVYESHPLYGYRPEPNQRVARNPKIEIKINNLGLRTDSDWDQNPHNKILFLGDSVTYGGSYIANDALFSHLTVQNIPGWHAGNAGVNGWGVSNVQAFIQEMEFLPADIYVSVFPEGDFYRGVNRIGGQPFWTITPKYALEELLQYGVYQLHLKKSPAKYAYENDEFQKTKIAGCAVADLKSLDDFLKTHHKQHLIYISPSRDQVVHQDPIDDTIKALLAKNNLNVVYIKDRLPVTCDCEKAQWFHDNIHLSQAGHQQWAAIIAADLAKVTEKAKG